MSGVEIRQRAAVDDKKGQRGGRRGQEGGLPLHIHVGLSRALYLFSPFLWEMTQNDPQGLSR